MTAAVGGNHRQGVSVAISRCLGHRTASALGVSSSSSFGEPQAVPAYFWCRIPSITAPKDFSPPKPIKTQSSPQREQDSGEGHTHGLYGNSTALLGVEAGQGQASARLRTRGCRPGPWPRSGAGESSRVLLEANVEPTVPRSRRIGQEGLEMGRGPEHGSRMRR